MKTPDGMEIKMCPSYPGYGASEDGRIWSWRNPGYGLRLDLPCHSIRGRWQKGYWYIRVPRVGLSRTVIAIHAMMLDAFIGPRPDGAVVRHLDGNPMNNHIANLRYGTAQDNSFDMIKHGNSQKGSRSAHTHLTEDEVRNIFDEYLRGYSIRQLAEKHKTGHSTMYRILCRQRWQHVPCSCEGEVIAMRVARTSKFHKSLIGNGVTNESKM